MFSRGLRALQRFSSPRGAPHTATTSSPSPGTVAAFRGFQSAAVSGSGNLGMRLAGGGLLTGSGVIMYNQSQGKQAPPLKSGPTPAWLMSLETKCQEVLSPGQMLRQHFLGRLVVEQDHVFASMIESGQIKSLRCFYDKKERKFHSVVDLGKNVAGYPGVVHGGLTAALIDETLGGLSVSIWRSGGFGVQAPPVTARLEVDYKMKVPANSTVLCTTELESIEGRKMWLRAHVTDGKSKVYASARALFVAPRVPGTGVVSRVMSGVSTSGSFLQGLIPGRRPGKDPNSVDSNNQASDVPAVGEKAIAMNSEPEQKRFGHPSRSE